MLNLEILNVIGLVFLKGKLLEPQSLTGVSCPVTAGLWKVWGKTESWFPIQAPQGRENLFRMGKKVEI